MLDLRHIKKSYAQPDGGRLPILDIANFQVATGEQLATKGT